MNSAHKEHVKSYYDQDSVTFKKRNEVNQTLQKIRDEFRAEIELYPAKSMLEIGYGPGFDIVYFAAKYPDRKVCGIDISPDMRKVALGQVADKQLQNVQLEVGTLSDIPRLFQGQKFDQIVVFFGALNTESAIDYAEDIFHQVLSDDGVMMLTIVNKWYLLGVLKPLLKMRFKIAFRRFQKVWGGYSLKKFLPSKCYSSRQVRNFFPNSELLHRRGFSILFPAWYENHLTQKFPKLSRRLWKIDLWLQKTPFWNLGEYSLYIFKKG